MATPALYLCVCHGRVFDASLMLLCMCVRVRVSLSQILKRNEQMYGLLAIVVALCPSANKALDENVTTLVCVYDDAHNDTCVLRIHAAMCRHSEGLACSTPRVMPKRT